MQLKMMKIWIYTFILLFLPSFLRAQVAEYHYDSSLVCQLGIRRIEVKSFKYEESNAKSMLVHWYLFDDKCRLVRDSSSMGISEFSYDAVTGKLVRRNFYNIQKEEFKYVDDNLMISTVYTSEGKSITKHIKSKSGLRRMVIISRSYDPLYFDSTDNTYNKNGLLVKSKVSTPMVHWTIDYFYDSSNRIVRKNDLTNYSNTYFLYSYKSTDSSSVVTEKYFNYDGKLIEVSSKKVFDRNKRLIEYKRPDLKYIYRYNDSGRLLKSESMSLNSNTSTVKNYTYNADGTIDTIEMIFQNKKVSTLKFTYYW